MALGKTPKMAPMVEKSVADQLEHDLRAAVAERDEARAALAKIRAAPAPKIISPAPITPPPPALLGVVQKILRAECKAPIGQTHHVHCGGPNWHNELRAAIGW